jgi:chromosome segregation ATPase
MSLTETLMLVALGFALALLVVLLFGRGFWALASNFGSKRKAKNIPVQMLELQADRDRLRAEHAIMSRKLELRLEEIKSRMTEQMAEVSRSRNRMQTLIEQLETSEATVANRDSEIAGLKAQVETYKTDLEIVSATLNSLSSDNNKKNLEIAKLNHAVSEFKLELREKKNLAASLAQEAKANLRVRVADIAQPRETEIADGNMQKRISELNSISLEMNKSQRDSFKSLDQPEADFLEFANAEMKAVSEVEFIDAEREAQALTQQLKSIDEALQPKRSSPYPAPTPVKSNAKANIISLTQRIRALQDDSK